MLRRLMQDHETRAHHSRKLARSSSAPRLPSAPAAEGVEQRIQRNPRTSNVIVAFPLLDVFLGHTVLILPFLDVRPISCITSL
jgi:hypothetical protein